MALALVTIIPALLVLWILRFIYNYNRLRSIPGPFLAGITDVWRWAQQNQKTFYGNVLTDLHRKYGTAVRIGPNLVSFSDPDAIPVIYGAKPIFRKVSTTPTIFAAPETLSSRYS